MAFRITLSIFALLTTNFFSQTVVQGNEKAASSAEAERKVMEATLEEILKLVERDSERGKLFRKAQNEWIQYVKEQAKADADGVSGEAKYPQSYFQTMRELTRYRTRVLEGCLSRLEAEKVGGRGSLTSAQANSRSSSTGSSVRDWKAEVGNKPLIKEATIYEATIEGVNGLLAGQWHGEELLRGFFIADRGDSMILYGGKMERGGVVFEAWQEGTRVGRGFVRNQESDLRGRFFDERRRESPMILKSRSRPNPVSYQVALTSYTGIVGTEPLNIDLEWHDTRFVRGKIGEERIVKGHNYAQGKLFLEERESGEEGKLVAVWSLKKKSSGGPTRWIGNRKSLSGTLEKVDFGR